MQVFDRRDGKIPVEIPVGIVIRAHEYVCYKLHVPCVSFLLHLLRHMVFLHTFHFGEKEQAMCTYVRRESRAEIFIFEVDIHRSCNHRNGWFAGDDDLQHAK